MHFLLKMRWNANILNLSWNIKENGVFSWTYADIVSFWSWKSLNKFEELLNRIS